MAFAFTKWLCEISPLRVSSDFSFFKSQLTSGSQAPKLISLPLFPKPHFPMALRIHPKFPPQMDAFQGSCPQPSMFLHSLLSTLIPPALHAAVCCTPHRVPGDATYCSMEERLWQSGESALGFCSHPDCLGTPCLFQPWHLGKPLHLTVFPFCLCKRTM